MNAIVFLDIDGVLNNHAPHANGYYGIKPDCVQRLNWLLYETDAKIVISSAWRYLVLKGSMTLKGFEQLLLTHGVDARDRIVGHTCSDEEIEPRGKQIRRWLENHRQETGSDPRYVVLDNMDLGITAEGLRFVLVDEMFGLADADVIEAVILITTEGDSAHSE